MSLPFCIPLYPISATFSASIAKLASFLPERFANSVFVGPGHNALTVTPVPFNSPYSDSVNNNS